MSKRTKKILVAALIVLVLLVAVFVGLRLLGKQGAQEGAKTLNISVVVSEDDVREYTLHTDAEYLRGALDEKKLIEGEESELGLFVTSVDGVSADMSKEQWWCVTKGGEMLMTGVDETPIADGDSFEITLMTGYDF